MSDQAVAPNVVNNSVGTFTEAAEAPKPSRKSEWFKAKRHTITLPSGTSVEIELPNLPALIKGGAVPNELLDAAIGAGPDTEVTREMIEQQADFYSYLVSVTVKDPSVAPEEVEQLPYEDVEMIAQFALRQRDMDAVYRHMSGLEKVSSFRRFRRLDGRDSAALDV
jgi:hypothetical protein